MSKKLSKQFKVKVAAIQYDGFFLKSEESTKRE
jgi:hypothetical protein